MHFQFFQFTDVNGDRSIKTLPVEDGVVNRPGFAERRPENFHIHQYRKLGARITDFLIRKSNKMVPFFNLFLSISLYYFFQVGPSNYKYDKRTNTCSIFNFFLIHRLRHPYYIRTIIILPVDEGAAHFRRVLRKQGQANFHRPFL